MAQATFDIEIALLNPGELWKEIEVCLRNCCEFEDRREHGWGFVVRAIKLPETSLSEKLKNFISMIAGAEELIRNSQPIIRIAVFNPNVTFTVVLEELGKICALGAKVELSVYSTDDSV